MAAPTNTTVIEPWTSSASPPTNWSDSDGSARPLQTTGAGYAQTPTTGYHLNYYNVRTYGPNVDLYAQMLFQSGVRYFALSLRMNSEGSAALNRYMLRWEPFVDGFWRIYKTVANADTSLAASAASQSMGTNDWMWFNAQGSTLTGYYSTNGSTWTQKVQVTNETTYTGAGHIGVDMDDNFSGTHIGPIRGGNASKPRTFMVNTIRPYAFGPGIAR